MFFIVSFKTHVSQAYVTIGLITYITIGLITYVTIGLITYVTLGLITYVTIGLITYVTIGLITYVTIGLITFQYNFNFDFLETNLLLKKNVVPLFLIYYFIQLWCFLLYGIPVV